MQIILWVNTSRFLNVGFMDVALGKPSSAFRDIRMVAKIL